MKYRPKNTLAYFNAAPQVHLHNLSGMPTAVFSASTLNYRKHCGTTLPTEDAVSFYTLNHCASIVRKTFTPNEPLPEWAMKIMTTYTNVAMAQGERMLHYILSITTREMRHLKSSTTATVWSTLKAQYGMKAADYLKNISSDGNEEVAVGKYMKQPPDVTVGEYTKALAYAFHHGAWSGGYGGHPWGHVTDALVSMLSGLTSMEMLVDTGYTLAHNGGPIFNKGMMYHHPDNNQLLTILDVQRSGQLPDLMLVSETMGVKKTQEAIDAVALIKTHCPVDAQGKPTLKGYVDWKLVDSLRPAAEKQGNPSKYTKVTGVQKQATKKPTYQQTVTPSPVMTTLLGKKVKVTGEWQVYPHQTVKIVVRVEN